MTINVNSNPLTGFAQFQAKSGTQYTADANGVFTNVAANDVESFVAAGHIVQNAIGIINVTAATLAVNAADHAGKIVTLNAAAGQAVTLPAATGTGNKYTFQVGTTITSNSTTITTGVTGASCDCYEGQAQQTGATGAITAFKTAAKGSSGSDVITFNGSTTGGIQGDIVEVTDIAAGVWMTKITGSITGTAATPFSHS